VLLSFVVPLPALAQPKKAEDVVKKLEARFEPAEAKPGQTVTLKIALELADGYSTYPTVQPDRGAASMTNRIVFPKPGAVVFVGKLEEPADPKVKAEPDLQIEELRYYPGGGTWSRKAVVSPDAKPGEVTVNLSNVSLLICDKNSCFPPTKVAVSAKLKVLDGPPVGVDPAYKDELPKK
jgi:hypothetical protein